MGRKATIAKGICGLGNRLLFLVRAILRCESQGTRLFVLWNDSMYSDAPESNAFYRCFRVASEWDAGFREVADIPSYRTAPVDPPLWTGRLHEDIYRLPAEYRDLRHASVGKSSSPKGFTDRNLEVYMGYPPAYRSPRLLKAFRQVLAAHVQPADWVRIQVDEFYRQYLSGSPSLGVHIRHCAADKRKVDWTSLDARIERFLKRNAVGRVFLATDSREVEARFQVRYGDRLVVRSKWFSPLDFDPSAAESASLHKRPPGLESEMPAPSRILQEAVTEMFLLSRCDQLCYQHNSSFSVVAAVYSTARRIFPWGEQTPTLAESVPAAPEKVETNV